MPEEFFFPYFRPCSTRYFLSFSPCENIGIGVEKTKLTHDQNEVKIESTMDISKVTDYWYVGSRVGKKHADELKVLDFDLIISMIGQMPPDEIYTLPPFRTLWTNAYDTLLLRSRSQLIDHCS
jgi:hypothetical protein